MKVRVKVRELASERKMSQGILSRKANVDLKNIQRLFSNPYRDISISTAAKIAWALDVSLNDLIEVSGSPHEEWAEAKKEAESHE